VLFLSNAGHTDIMEQESSGFEEACQAIEAFLAKVLE
jgi:hypothetical protein